MTAHPKPENHSHWWLTTPKWERLHAIPGDALAWEDLSAAMDDGAYVCLRGACGADLDVTMPGLVSRYGMPRCAHCCRALGIPRGDGTPVNESSRQRARSEP